MMQSQQKITMKYTVAQLPGREDGRATLRCYCRPPSLQSAAIGEKRQAFALDLEQITPLSSELYAHLSKRLGTLFPRSAPFSLVLLHIAQVERAGEMPARKTAYYHAPPALLDEVMARIRRSVRRNDYILTHEGVGAALLFPGIDERGIYGIIERIYHNISLISNEESLLSLAPDTMIVMGVSSYPSPSSSVEQLLNASSRTAYRFALPSGSRKDPCERDESNTVQPLSWEEDERDTRDRLPVVDFDCSFTRLPLTRSAPYMQLPARVLPRLKQIIPYDVARAVQCVPVGRNHHSLTVAMASPRNTVHIHLLQEVTGLTIFPVSCDPDALQLLLADSW